MLVSAFCLTVVLGSLVCVGEGLEKVREYFRVSGTAGEIAEGRMLFWRYGIQDVKEHWLFGRGGMAKFGGAETVARNTYSEDENPHNTWLITAQSYGVPGAILYALAFLAMLSWALRGRGMMPTLAAGTVIMGFGMSISQNWSFSFGNETDRACWLLLGLALASAQGIGGRVPDAQALGGPITEEGS